MSLQLRKLRDGWADAAKAIGAEPFTHDEQAWIDMPNKADDDWTW